MATNLGRIFLTGQRNSRLFYTSLSDASNTSYGKHAMLRKNHYLVCLNYPKPCVRRFASLNLEVGSQVATRDCGRYSLNYLGARSRTNQSSGLQANLKHTVQRYCTNTGYEELQDKVRQLLSKSPTASKEKLDEQVRVLDMLCQHKAGKATSAEVTEAAKNIHGDILYELGLVVYALQEQVGEDTIEFWAPLFRLASLAGNQDAKYTYAQMLRSGTGIDPDPLEAAKLFHDLADDQHPYAQFALAGMHYHGIGVEKDYPIAFDLYEKSSKNGVDMALSYLGNMYLNGEGVEQNYKLALQLFHEGLKKGDPTAELSLANCYSYGKGVTQDLTKAFEYHLSAAEKGHPIALYNVGTQYFAGKGVELNMEKAAEYFEKAANMGFELAQINLGNMYYNGLGIEKDWNRAKELYRQAAPTNKNAAALLKEIEEDERKLKEQNPDE